jgi:GTP-binding protein
LLFLKILEKKKIRTIDKKMKGVTKQNKTLKNKKNLFANKCNFIKGVASIEGLEHSSVPEVAFLGRSNVGKSSLLNAITKRSKLAHTSKTPGRTQELNFFSFGDEKPMMTIVDMPGYGFAKASKTKIAEWTELSRHYLSNRSNLRRVFLLIDARHDIKPSDEEIMSMLDNCAVSYQIILTKIDKIKDKNTKISKTQDSVKSHVAVHPVVYSTSSYKDIGLGDLRDAISSLVD